MRHRSKNKFLESNIFGYTRSTLFGIAVIILCLIGFSAVMTYITAPPPVISAMSNVSLCIGCSVAGYTAAKKRKKNGMLTGVYTGAVIYCVIYFLGVIILGRFVSLSAFGKFIMVIICSSIGGILGVNTKIKRPHL